MFLKVECVCIMYSLKKDKKSVNQNVSIRHLQSWIVLNFIFSLCFVVFLIFCKKQYYFIVMLNGILNNELS